MCGICGFLGFEDRGFLLKMTETLAHRGRTIPAPTSLTASDSGIGA